MSDFLDYLLQKWLRGEQPGPHGNLSLFVQLLLFLGLTSCSIRCSIMAGRRGGFGRWFAIEIEDENEASDDQMKQECNGDSNEDCGA